MRPQRVRNGAAAEHAPPHPAAHPRQAQPPLTRARAAILPLIAALALGGCGSGPAAVSLHEPILAPEAILAGETGLEISFGRAREGAVTAATRLVGRQPESIAPVPGCGAGDVTAVRYPGGLTLNFTTGGFAGWVARDEGRAWQASNGLRTGMSGAEAAGLAGGIGVVPGADGRVAILYAGLACLPR